MQGENRRILAAYGNGRGPFRPPVTYIFSRPVQTKCPQFAGRLRRKDAITNDLATTRPSLSTRHDPNHSLARVRATRPRPAAGSAGQGQARGADQGQLLQGRSADLPAALPGVPSAGQAAGRLRDDRPTPTCSSRATATNAASFRQTAGEPAGEAPRRRSGPGADAEGERPAHRDADQAHRRLGRAGGDRRHARVRAGPAGRCRTTRRCTNSSPSLTAWPIRPTASCLPSPGITRCSCTRGTGRGLVARLVGLSERIQSLAFSPDGKTLAASRRRPGTRSARSSSGTSRSRRCSCRSRSRSTRSTA